MAKHPLTIISWEDSCIGHHGWQAISDIAPKPAVCRIASVGWIVKRTKKALTLAQNVGGIDRKATGQVSNLIHIPTSCIISESRLTEAED
jgi:hypothetical protein